MQFESLDDFDAETGAERLLDVTPAGQPSAAGTPISLSRGESQQARLRRHSLGAAIRRLSSRVRERLVKKTLSGPGAAGRDPESDGVIIATLLVIATVAYGSFLTALSTR